MPAKGVSMRKLREIIRLYFECHLSNRAIAKSLSLGVGTVNKYLQKIKAISKEPRTLLLQTETELRLLIKNQAPTLNIPGQSSIDCQYIHQEMKRKGVTLQLLWEEYAQDNASSLGYSRFCHHYRIWKSKQPSSMRQTHKAGDKVFIDYSGQTIEIIDPETGEIRSAELFVGVLGASNYTYAEATWTQRLSDFIGSQQRMFKFFGGVPALVVPDNLKSAINKTCRYEPDVNPTYADFITHYETAVLPTRPYKPKDKAKVEVGVQIAQRWILARLRHHTFIGLTELNSAIRSLLIKLNDRSFKKLPGNRLEAFKAIDLPELKALPVQEYVYRHYKKVRVNIDYHFELNGHYYSVPNQYCRAQLDVWYTDTQLTCFIKGESIAAHPVSRIVGAHTTTKKHMPQSHQKQQEWSPGRFLSWAKSIGDNTETVVKMTLHNRAHVEQAYRSCLGILNLAKQYSSERLEAACAYAISINAINRKSIVSILKNALDQKPYTQQKETNIGHHHNVRGPYYYH